MCPTEFYILQTTQFSKNILNGKGAFIITSKMNALDGTFKTTKGGILQVKETPNEIPIFDLWVLDGKVNVCKVVEK